MRYISDFSCSVTLFNENCGPCLILAEAYTYRKDVTPQSRCPVTLLDTGKSLILD